MPQAKPRRRDGFAIPSISIPKGGGRLWPPEPAKKDMTMVMSFFAGSGGQRRPPPFGIEMLGMAKPSLRRGFACGKTLERRKSGAAQKGRRTRFKTADSKF